MYSFRTPETHAAVGICAEIALSTHWVSLSVLRMRLLKFVLPRKIWSGPKLAAIIGPRLPEMVRVLCAFSYLLCQSRQKPPKPQLPRKVVTRRPVTCVQARSRPLKKYFSARVAAICTCTDIVLVWLGVTTWNS